MRFPRTRLRNSLSPVRTAVRWSHPPACSPCAGGSATISTAPPRRVLPFGRVADDAGDDAGDAPIVGVEGGFEIERALGSFHRGDRFAACVHDTLTPAAAGL